jgi:hypothetical protein
MQAITVGSFGLGGRGESGDSSRAPAAAAGSLCGRRPASMRHPSAGPREGKQRDNNEQTILHTRLLL